MTASADDVADYLETVLDVLRLIPGCPQGWTDDCRPSAKTWIERQLAQEKCIGTLVDAARSVVSCWETGGNETEIAACLETLRHVLPDIDWTDEESKKR